MNFVLCTTSSPSFNFQGEKEGIKWEHVGSTSIKGMPGTMMPDALIIPPEFPPSKGVIQALLDCGYYFSSSAALDQKVRSNDPDQICVKKNFICIEQ